MREQLLELFEYDLWANHLWIEAIPSLPDSVRAAEIMRHILRAQHVWLVRCLSEEANTALCDDLESEACRLNESWKELIRIADLGAYIAYDNLAGEPCMSLLEDLALHVANHGTYHRGQLRGLCESWGADAFPETDFIKFTRLKP